MNEIPLLLKCLMEETHMSVPELAKRADTTAPTVRRILSGKSSGSLAKIDQILEVFGCRVTIRRVPNVASDIDPQTGKFKRPYDDPIEGNETINSILVAKYPKKTDRP